MNEEDFDEVVAEVIDDKVTPRAMHGSSQVSSGISSGASVLADNQPRSSSPDVQPSKSILRCKQCPKTYKTEKGFQRHLFLHKIEDYNRRRPRIEIAAAFIDDRVLAILDEISEEPNSPQEKLDIISELKMAAGSPNWVQFLNLLSDPIIDALTSRTKLLPSNQYEEFMTNFNKFLNAKEQFESLKLSFLTILKDTGNSRFVGLVLSRICSRLPEEVQIFVVKEMAKGGVVCVVPDTVVNDDAFAATVSNMLRCYFIRACRIPNEIWRMRCSCVKDRFVSFQDESTSEDNNLLLKSNWVDGNIAPSSSFLKFCRGVEDIIRDKIDKKVNINEDELVTTLLGPHFPNITECWYLLTFGYFSEIDSVVFMRDFVSILFNKSMRLEELKIQAEQEESQKLRKVATSENLKRN